MRTRFPVSLAGVGVAVALWSGVASADIQTFWKTASCPDFGGSKPPIASELGVMQAPINTIGGGVGGAFCVTYSADLSGFDPAGLKVYEVFNADVVVAPGDAIGMAFPGATWNCIVCQYEDKVAAHPALSMWGTIALMGGVVTAMIFELRRRQGAEID